MSCIYERTKFAAEISYEISDSHGTSNDTVYVNGEYMVPVLGEDILSSESIPITYHFKNNSAIINSNNYQEYTDMELSLRTNNLLKIIVGDIIDLYPTLHSFYIKSRKLQRIGLANEWRMKFKIKNDKEEKIIPFYIVQSYGFDDSEGRSDLNRYFSRFTLIKNEENHSIVVLHDVDAKYRNDLIEQSFHRKPSDQYIIDFAIEHIYENYKTVSISETSYKINFSIELVEGSFEYIQHQEIYEDVH